MIRTLPGGVQVWMTCISAGRATRVKPMEELVGPLTWYVPPHQKPEYAYQGARSQRPGSDTSLVEVRNRALSDAWEQRLPCLMLDDDLRKMYYKPAESTGAPFENRWSTDPDRIQILIGMVAKTVMESPYRLGGIPPTDNPYFANSQIRTRVFCRSHFWVVRPCGLWLDPNLKTKEDYDYTIKHISKYGGVCRVDSVIGDFDFATEAGGCQTTRSLAGEMEAVLYLEKKWGTKIIKRNKRRAGEILLRFPKQERIVMA
jgi:hypothetical protein